MGEALRRLLIALAMGLALPTVSLAGFGEWSSEVEKDPFSKGQRVTVNNMTSIRSGVLMICDSSEKGLTVRIIPGFAAVEKLAGYEPHVEFAVDETLLFGQGGETGSVGDNLAVAQVQLTPQNAKILVDAFTKAKKQVAIKDGISDRPHLMSSRGSTKSGAALTACMDKQSQ